MRRRRIPDLAVEGRRRPILGPGPLVDPGIVHVLQPSLTALRPDDLLALRLTWLNLELKDGALVREPDAKDAYIVIEFEPQHVADQAYFETAGSDYPVETPPDTKRKEKDAGKSASEKLPVPWNSAQARLAGSSRLAFRVPDGIDSLPCTLEALLAACSEFPLSVVATAPPPPPPLKKGHMRKRPILVLGGVREPASEETAIEAPWRLVLSPNELCAWLHARGLVQGATSGRVELWHTRLGTRPGSGRTETIHDGRYRYVPGADGEWHVDHYQDAAADFNRTVRAVWSPDHMKRPPAPDNTPFRMSLDRNDRHQLVALMSDPGIKNWRSRFTRARRLMLSSLGAWLDLDYASAPPADVSALTIEAWRHLATIGRDHYVRVVYAGYLFPFGHHASLVKVTERKFQRRPRATSDEAFLRQRMYIIVRQPDVEVAASRRQMPFRRVRITTVVTPNLDPPDQDPARIKKTATKDFNRQGFWPIVNGAPFLFNVVAWDWENRRSEFSAPLIFIDRQIDDQPTSMTKIKEAYQAKSGQGDPLWRRRPFSGQQVAFAHPRQEPGSTSLQTESIEFLADAVGNAAPHFSPVVESAHVRIPAVDQLVGSSEATKITIDTDYVDDGWPTPAKGDVFARVPDAMPMKFRADRSGGVATPNLSIGGISRRFGPVGGSGANVGAFNDGTFTPSEFFAGAQAKILGGIDLFQIVQPLSGLVDTGVPKLTSKPEGPVDAPTALITSLLWKPGVQKHGPFQPWGGAQTSFELEATVRTDLVDPTKSESVVKGKLTGFDMNLFGFVVLPFTELAFDTKPGQKTHVSAELGEVSFGGPLAFVNELREYLGGDGFKDPPSLEVTSEGVTAGFSLELPTVAVGVMTLQNISLGAALNLPFTGDPVRFRFSFCSRERPFQLLIYCFGGGGFFAIAIGLDGVEQIEASLEFGAAISIDVGVASGGVHLMAGIYYSWKEAEKKAWLEGYLRMGGELDVLGLVSMSLEFIMSLAHDSSTNIVWGEAKLIVEIEVAFFSDSVEMSVRRQLGDPPRVMFEHMLEPGDWDTYWSAFAAA